MRWSKSVFRLSFANEFRVRASRAPLTARQWFERLRERKILVRWWDADRIRDFARVTVGADEEMDRFLEATREEAKR
jgi:histidinol-phosphate/aromatic aminotransferase/cobyric acid decarboxylase-like protein